jgi:hypothetical protein
MIFMNERRIEPRLMCADMVQISWGDSEGKRCRAMALLEDIAPSGACLQLEAPIPIGAVVKWTSPRQEFRGIIRHCVYREIGYFAGVEFTASNKWSKSAYRPQHLFDPRRLAR